MRVWSFLRNILDAGFTKQNFTFTLWHYMSCFLLICSVISCDSKKNEKFEDAEIRFLENGEMIILAAEGNFKDSIARKLNSEGIGIAESSDYELA